MSRQDAGWAEKKRSLMQLRPDVKIYNKSAGRAEYFKTEQHSEVVEFASELSKQDENPADHVWGLAEAIENTVALRIIAACKAEYAANKIDYDALVEDGNKQVEMLFELSDAVMNFVKIGEAFSIFGKNSKTYKLAQLQATNIPAQALRDWDQLIFISSDGTIKLHEIMYRPIKVASKMAGDNDDEKERLESVMHASDAKKIDTIKEMWKEEKDVILLLDEGDRYTAYVLGSPNLSGFNNIEGAKYNVADRSWSIPASQKALIKKWLVNDHPFSWMLGPRGVAKI